MVLTVNTVVGNDPFSVVSKIVVPTLSFCWKKFVHYQVVLTMSRVIDKFLKRVILRRLSYLRLCSVGIEKLLIARSTNTASFVDPEVYYCVHGNLPPDLS